MVSPAQNPVILSIAGLALACNVALMALYWRRRFFFPIKGRLPKLCLLSSVFLNVYLVWLAVQRATADDYPCAITFFHAHSMTGLTVSAFFLRLWVLHFAYNATNQMLGSKPVVRANWHARTAAVRGSIISNPDMAEGADLPLAVVASKSASASSTASAGDLDWYLRNRHRVSAPYLLRVFLFVFLLQNVAPVALIIALPNARSVSLRDCEDYVIYSDATFLLAFIIYIAILLAFAFRLKRFRDDGFSIKRELRLVATVLGGGLIVWVVLDRAPGLKSFSRDEFALQTLWLVIVVASLSAVVIGFPLWLSYRQERDGAREVDSLGHELLVPEDNTLNAHVRALRNMLKVPAAIDALQKFLASEFSLENILFWEEVELFRDLYARDSEDSRLSRTRGSDNAEGSKVRSADSILSENSQGSRLSIELAAHRIYDKYIAPGAPCEVNLAFDITEAVRARLGLPPSAQPRRESLELTGVAVAPHDAELKVDANIAPDVFDAAQHAILVLIANDSFRRFQTSPAYHDLVASLRKQGEQLAIINAVEK